MSRFEYTEGDPPDGIFRERTARRPGKAGRIGDAGKLDVPNGISPKEQEEIEKVGSIWESEAFLYTNETDDDNGDETDEVGGASDEALRAGSDGAENDREETGLLGSSGDTGNHEDLHSV